MNKKLLLIVAPVSLLIGSLIGCNNKEVQFTVTFDTDGGTSIPSVNVKKGEKVARPIVTPTKDGYTFIDWYVAKDGDTKFDFGNAINQNTTIYAHYKGLSEEEKFYVAYQTASENFQKSDKGYDQYDLIFKFGDITVDTLQSLSYGLDEENARECILDIIGSENGIVLAGGNMKYYEDSTKGIKASIKTLKDEGYTITYNTDTKLKTCSFTAINGETSMSSTFNKDGYLIKGTVSGVENEKVEFSVDYLGELHNTQKNVDAQFDGSVYTASASNLVQRDLIRVIIDDYDIATHPFNVIECPGFKIVDNDIENDIRVSAIYNDNFSWLTEGTDYIVTDGKVILKADRNTRTIVDLKVTNAAGIPNLTINAKRNINANWDINKYASDDAGTVTAGTMLSGTIVYSSEDKNGVNAIFLARDETQNHDLKINDTSATINVSKVVNANGDDITSGCTTISNVLFTPKRDPLKQNIYITFTVTKSINNLFLAALYVDD